MADDIIINLTEPSEVIANSHSLQEWRRWCYEWVLPFETSTVSAVVPIFKGTFNFAV
jgi:hypothetical protein